mgnify:CR=1 FL=1
MAEQAMRLPGTVGTGVHWRIHLGAWGLALIMLPWSEFLLSLSQILLVGNGLWEGIATRELGGRFKRAFTTRESAVFLSFFGLNLLGLLWTTDLKWGINLCRILLPVLVFGVVLSSVPRLTARQLRDLLLLGAWSATASTLACWPSWSWPRKRSSTSATSSTGPSTPSVSRARPGCTICPGSTARKSTRPTAGARSVSGARTASTVCSAHRLLAKRTMSDDICLLYTSDAADERSSVDLGGRRIIKKTRKPR